MKIFKDPVIEIITFAVEDIIATSATDPTATDEFIPPIEDVNQTPYG